MPEPNRAQEIASEAVDLADTEVLVLTLPEDLATRDDSFQNFAAELRAAIGEDLATRVRVVVLKAGMELTKVDRATLAAVGLRTTESHPHKAPELLFEAGPLRNAARAGWDSANGDAASAELCADTARKALAEEIRVQTRLGLSTQ